MDFFFLICAFFFYFIAFGLSPSGLGYDWFFLFFDLELPLPFYCLWFKSVGFRLWWIFFVFWFGASSSILLPLAQVRRVKAMMVFFCFLIWGFFFHFIAFGLSPSGLGYDGFFLFFDLGLFLPFYCVRFKSVWFRLWWFFFCVFDLGLVFAFYCLWFKSVGFRLWWFFLFFNLGPFFYIIAFGLSPSG